MISTIGAAVMSLAAGVTASDRLQVGTVSFAPCELSQPRSATTTAAWCTPFEVPEDRANPNGRKITLKLALVASDIAAIESDPIVLLAGGPGQAATETWPTIAPALQATRRYRHVVLLDQRGTGGSNALSCKQPDADADADFDVALAGELARRCLDEIKAKADPHFYTTTDAVEDLEAVRVALGGVKFNLVGISYGTRVAQQYMLRHPDGVRSAVLDGIAPNELIFGEEFARNLDDALKGRFALCAKDKACSERYGDIYKALYETREKYQREPAEVAMRDPQNFQTKKRRFDRNLFDGLVRLFAYAPESAALLPFVIHEAAAGNTAPIVAQAEYVTRELADGMTAGMGLSVACAEDVDLIKERADDKALILGDTMVAALRAQCEHWPKGRRPADFHQPVKSDLPVLILSGEFDPVTPPRYGDAVMKGLTRGRHLVAPGQGHNVIGRGCVPRLVKRFIDKLETDQLDAGCIAELGATPFFIDYNGATP
ncbi:MAG TPA: alpha/beta hydrolase [Tahibacter sp.]|nr:alpha/beta hydrolase [Tahibacter sp.]